jgi:hypothetical protein
VNIIVPEQLALALLRYRDGAELAGYELLKLLRAPELRVFVAREQTLCTLDCCHGELTEGD